MSDYINTNYIVLNLTEKDQVALQVEWGISMEVDSDGEPTGVEGLVIFDTEIIAWSAHIKSGDEISGVLIEYENDVTLDDESLEEKILSMVAKNQFISLELANQYRKNKIPDL